MKPTGQFEQIANLVLEKLLPALKIQIDSSLEDVAVQVASRVQHTLVQTESFHGGDNR